MLKSYGYKFSGYFMEYGPVFAQSEEDARALIRRRMNVKRLPYGLQIWDLAERPITKWRVATAS